MGQINIEDNLVQNVRGVFSAIIDLDIGLLEKHLCSNDSLRAFERAPRELHDDVWLQLLEYKDFLVRIKEAGLNVDSDFRKILEVACQSFGIFTDTKQISGILPDDITFHAYAPSGKCVFFSPNFLHKMDYDFLSLIVEPWFELFGREHHDDLDIFMKSTQQFQSEGRKDLVDISSVRSNTLYLEKKPNRPKFESRGFFYSPIFDNHGLFMATLVASAHHGASCGG
jgi:hypothetical protein